MKPRKRPPLSPRKELRKDKGAPAGEKPAGEAPVTGKSRFTGDPTAKGAGRKTVLLEGDKMESLMNALIAGNTVRNACELSKVSESAFYRWMQEAEHADEGSLVKEFREKVRHAIATAEHRNVMVIQQAARKNWGAAAWYLERRRPQEWGRSDRLAIGGDPNGVPIATTSTNTNVNVNIEVERVMTDDEALAALRGVLEREDEKVAKGRTLESK